MRFGMVVLQNDESRHGSRRLREADHFHLSRGTAIILLSKERRDAIQQIILTSEQARIVQEAKEAVEVRDPLGRILSFLQPMDSLDVEAVYRHRSTRNQPRLTVPAAKVQAHMRRLEEIRQTEGMNKAKMDDLLKRMQAGEEV